MDNKKIIAACLLLFLSLAPLVFAAKVSVRHRRPMAVTSVPTPRLTSPIPVDGKVNLKGKNFLTFEWSTEGDPTQRVYYDFRVYKGYVMVASTLVFKERTSNYKIDVKSEIFKNGQAYRWAVRQVYKNGNKSRRDFSTFTPVR